MSYSAQWWSAKKDRKEGKPPNYSGGGSDENTAMLWMYSVCNPYGIGTLSGGDIEGEKLYGLDGDGNLVEVTLDDKGEIVWVPDESDH